MAIETTRPGPGLIAASDHQRRLDWIEAASGNVVASASDYPDGSVVAPHRHGRAQLLHALSGVLMVATGQGRWMVPTEHAMWIPAGVDHSVEMLGTVRMRSVYVLPGAARGVADGLRVVGMTPLMRSLIMEAVEIDPSADPGRRAELIMALILEELPLLPERPFALPFPSDPRLAALCRYFLAQPTPHTTIDEWAQGVGMSRRAFTRAFLHETGLSLSVWRQQASLFAALPRLADGESITTVALDLGYDSAPAFTTMFRRMLGASPRSYLRRHAATGRVR